MSTKTYVYGTVEYLHLENACETPGVTFTPSKADITILKDDVPLGTWRNQQTLTNNVSEPGVYRVEVHRSYLDKKRGWIYSNPIYVR